MYKMYKIAEENGKVGHATNNLRVSINLGLKKGYDGFTQEKSEVLNLLTDDYKERLERGENYIPFVVQETVITYAYEWEGKIHAEHEPALVLTSDKSPIYADDKSEEEWKDLVTEYVEKLGKKFDQFRIYVSYERVETCIFQKQQ